MLGLDSVRFHSYNSLKLFGHHRLGLGAQQHLSRLVFALHGILIVLSVRPKVAELAFQLYGRSLHPELFDIFESRSIERGNFQARVDITRDGHIVTFGHDGMILTEVASAQTQPLPQRRRIFSHKVGGEQSESLHKGGIHYQTSFQLEEVPPEIFWSFHQELTHDSQLSGMVYSFNNSGRVQTGALSYINLETRQNTLLVQAFHTFPNEYAIVKSQSVFTV